MTGKSCTLDPSATPARSGTSCVRYLNAACAKWRRRTSSFSSTARRWNPRPINSQVPAKALRHRAGRDRPQLYHQFLPLIHVTERQRLRQLAFGRSSATLSPGGAISYVGFGHAGRTTSTLCSGIAKFIYDSIMCAELNTKATDGVCGYDGEISAVEDEDGKLVCDVPELRQPRPEQAERRPPHLRLHRLQFWNQGRTQEIKERVLHL